MKKVLIVIDYQKDFVDGALPCGQAAVDIKENIIKKIDEAIINEDQIIFTMDTHKLNEYSISKESELFPNHCIDGTEGQLLYIDSKELNMIYNYDVIEKNTYGSYKLVELLLEGELDDFLEMEIEVVGVATNVCVLHNVIMIYNALPLVPVTVDASCCASWDETLHNQALDLMAGFGINIIGRD